jgi:hypothetical protein
VEWDVSQKVKSKKKMRQKNVFGDPVTHGNVR